jgi:predicted transcriptional regulator
MHRQPRPLARRSRLQRVQGFEIEERVWRCYTTGKRQVAIAAELNLSESRVSRYVARRLQRIEENAPRSTEELAVMRERLAAGIWATVAESHMKPTVLDEQGHELEMPAAPQMLIIRLKAFEQLAKLYGLNMESKPQREDVKPYSTPPEIAEEIRKLILARYPRCTDTGQRIDAATQRHEGSD